MKIRKSRYIKSNGTYCYIEKFNMALSLCGVLGVTLYFFKGFLEAATKTLQLLEVTMVCFLGQEFNL